MNRFGWQLRQHFRGIDRAIGDARRNGDVERAEALRVELAVLYEDAKHAVDQAEYRRAAAEGK